MDIEFHYYITYLIAVRAGFSDEEAYVLAYASQQTDDNSEVITIGKGTEQEYSNYISQTSNILKPEKDLMQIYPIFHFMPGTKEEIESDEACRRDGKFHVLNTIPDNSNARKMLKAALASNSLYRIGIAAHMFADTFAHQNFVGYYESFNAMKGLLDKAIPDVGHADAKHDPDLPGLQWDDLRLVSKYTEVSNKDRFLKAAGRIFEEFRRYRKPGITDGDVGREKAALLAELTAAIGKTGNHAVDSGERENRIAAYTTAIGKQNAFTDYDEHAWLDQAASRKGIFSVFRAWADYAWKPDHEKSHWYLFQEAVKKHQWETKEAVLDAITGNLELERWNS